MAGSKTTKKTSLKEGENITTNQDNDSLLALKNAEKALDHAYSTGKAERSAITGKALADAQEAVRLAGIALEADEVADEASKLAIITEHMNDREATKTARSKEREARKQARRDHSAATKQAKQAYDAIKFSEPNRMGFLRVVMIIFALHIMFTLLMLIMTSRDKVVYDSANLADWIMIILEGIAFWFFINRYKIARQFVIGMSLFGIIASWGYDLIMGVFSPFVAIINSLFYIFLLVYFIVSKRVKQVLVNDISTRAGDYDKATFTINRKGWPFIRNLAIYFVIFAVLGHWMEAGMCQFIILGLAEGSYNPNDTVLWRDWLYPFPMEGAAVVFIALFLYPLKEWLDTKFKNPVIPYVLSFLANAFVCTAIEFTMGLIMNSDHAMWDYSDHFGNIMGQVCLQNTIAFGLAASIITWFVYPLLERWIARIPRDIMNIVFVVVMIFGGILWSLYIINPPEQLKEISNSFSYNQAQNLDNQTDYNNSIQIIETTAKIVQDEAAKMADLDETQQKEVSAYIDQIIAGAKGLQSVFTP